MNSGLSDSQAAGLPMKGDAYGEGSRSRSIHQSLEAAGARLPPGCKSKARWLRPWDSKLTLKKKTEMGVLVRILNLTPTCLGQARNLWFMCPKGQAMGFRTSQIQGFKPCHQPPSHTIFRSAFPVIRFYFLNLK